MAKRRTVILGLGALTFGSGALSVNAAFSNSVSPASDMRVVAARDLTVAPGIGFRSGTSPTDPYDTTLDGSSGNFYSETNENFFSTGTPSTGGDDDLGGGLSPSDLPAISVNDATDGSLSIKVATLNNASTHTFSDALQVTNAGDVSEEVGVKFEVFGVDTTGAQTGAGGAVEEKNVVSSYLFKDSAGNQISTDASHFDTNNISTVGGQQILNSVTIPSGSTEQIDLEVTLDSTIVSQIASASNAGGNPWAGDQDTVQLVDTVRFGSDPSATTNP
jgi:hypothetical protein